MNNLLVLILTISTSVLYAIDAYACDPCSLYNASRLQEHSTGSFNFSISEQYTDFDKAQEVDSEEASNSQLVTGFSVTQLAFSYDINSKTGLQINLPFISRSYDKISDGMVDDGTEQGIGDISLTGNYLLVNYKKSDWTFLVDVTAGIKFPTGDTGVLGDLHEGHDEMPADSHDEHMHDESLTLLHGDLGSASGGHVLSLGTGSYDFILGTSILNRYRRYLLISNLQYTFRQEGDFNYEFGNDLIFSTSPGYYFIVDDSYTIAGAVTLTGEYKDQDRHNGEDQAGSSFSNLFLGPSLLATIDKNWSMETTFDFRVSGEDAGNEVVPEKRFKASLAYRW